MKLTIEADSNRAWLSTASGHDVARIERITLDEWPDLEPENYLDDAGWQGLIDSIHAPANACEGLVIPDKLPPGTLTALVAAARAGLDYLKRTNPLEHGDPDLGRTWGALEDALAPFPAND